MFYECITLNYCQHAAGCSDVTYYHVSLQFLEQCDEVLYMKDGLISERGTHDELIARGGDYYQMLQFDQTRDQKTSGDVEIEQTVEVEGGG
jgi:ABC-type multidrug transport system ATPase subunit